MKHSPTLSGQSVYCSRAWQNVLQQNTYTSVPPKYWYENCCPKGVHIRSDLLTLAWFSGIKTLPCLSTKEMVHHCRVSLIMNEQLIMTHRLSNDMHIYNIRFATCTLAWAKLHTHHAVQAWTVVNMHNFPAFTVPHHGIVQVALQKREQSH